jgi:hypothetical protein
VRGPGFHHLTAAERAEVVRLLEDGHSAARVAVVTKRGIGTVSRVRDEEGIAPLGRWPVGTPQPVVERPDDPWIPMPGHDLHGPRPHQQQWLALVAAASPGELDRLRSAMCTVLGLAPICSDDSMVRALIADRRTAEVLAGEYMAARGAQAVWPA